MVNKLIKLKEFLIVSISILFLISISGCGEADYSPIEYSSGDTGGLNFKVVWKDAGIDDGNVDKLDIFGAIAGTLTDSASSDPIENGTVITNAGASGVITDGSYFMVHAAGTNIDVTAMAAGYESNTVFGVTVNEDSTTMLNFQLESSSAGDDKSVSIPCESAGIETVTFEVYEFDTLLLPPKSFDCSAGEGTIDGVPVGSNRNLVIVAHDISGNTIYFGRLTGITVTAGNDTALGSIECGRVDTLNGLIAYYPFNGNANDESGNGNTGSVDGATLTNGQYGDENSAFKFDGDGDRIIVPDNPELQLGTGSFSISLWIKTTTTEQQAIIDKDYTNTPSGGFRIWIDSTSSSVNYQLWNDYSSSYLRGIGGITPINDGIWHHVVAIRDTSSSKLRLYIDGKEDVIAVDDDPTGNINNSQQMAFGGYSLDDRGSLEGSIDDIRIYTRVLSESDTQGLFRNIY